MDICAGGNSSVERRSGGFTLLELLTAMAIVAMVLAVSVPAAGRIYASMQYREAVRSVVGLFATARLQAVKTGLPQSIEVNPGNNELRLNGDVEVLPKEVALAVHSARELNRGDIGIIRFYPEGGSSGGGVDIERSGSGVKIMVDWLTGRVSHEKYEVN